MSSSLIKSGTAGREAVLAGIDKAANSVKGTLGPLGKNVTLDTNQFRAFPMNTNDGASILRSLEKLADPFETVGLKIVKEAASKTDDTAGDGTTTASVLLQAIVHYGLKAINNGANPVRLRQGINWATNSITEWLQEEAISGEDIKMLEYVATISCSDREIGSQVAKAVQDAGEEGIVTLEDNPDPETVVEKLEGMKLRGSFTVGHFINTPETQQAVYHDALILVTNMNITLADEILAIFEAANSRGKKEAVIIANSIESDALMTAIKNHIEGRFKSLPVRVMSYGDMGEGILRDIAAITGATFYDGAASMNIRNVTGVDLGTAQKVVADKHYTTIVADNADAKIERIKELKGQILSTDRDFEKENLRERIAKLDSAMLTVKVGANNDSEREERRERVKDAINATKAAKSFGVVAGGGSALFRAATNLDTSDLSEDLYDGAKAVIKACSDPLYIMAYNGAIDLEKSEIQAILDTKKAIDFTTGRAVDAFKEGIVDPVKVAILALMNAATSAGLFLVTDTFVASDNLPEEKI